MMGQLASALAHELNQPLGAILRNADLRYAKELGADLRFESTISLRDSLQGADFVINTASASSHGKQAGEPCAHLTPSLACDLFGSPERPAVCGSLQPSAEM